ncbi:MAG: hypothetical protein L0207_00765 [Chlamydiae bacterium]|nr:hypothetical protein [Chlamydiota bacterium]
MALTSQGVKDIKFQEKIKVSLQSLEIQRSRIFDPSSKCPLHDVDFYLIILRRLYRQIEDLSTHDSRVANFKGKNAKLFQKILLRDDFEHGPKELIPQLSKEKLSQLGIIDAKSKINLTIIKCLKIKKDSIIIFSGDKTWDLKKDHENFIQVIDEFISLYPYKRNLNLPKKVEEN